MMIEMRGKRLLCRFQRIWIEVLELQSTVQLLRAYEGRLRYDLEI